MLFPCAVIVSWYKYRDKVAPHLVRGAYGKFWRSHFTHTQTQVRSLFGYPHIHTCTHSSGRLLVVCRLAYCRCAVSRHTAARISAGYRDEANCGRPKVPSITSQEQQQLLASELRTRPLYNTLIRIIWIYMRWEKGFRSMSFEKSPSRRQQSFAISYSYGG